MIADLTKILNAKFNMFLNDRSFIINVLEETSERVVVEIALSNADKSFYYPVQGMIVAPKEQDLDIQDAVFFLIDYIELYFDDYFHDSENLFVPIDWSPCQYDAVDFFLKGQVVNQKLDAQADQILELH